LVTTIIGEAGVNIDDMDVGKTAEGQAALMAISTATLVPDEVVDAIRSQDGVNDARAIDLE
jgi:D-3-phosphoglycerate dehydrogenase